MTVGGFLFLEHQRSVLHQIWLHIRIPRPSFTLKPVKTGFLFYKNAEYRRCSIFGTSDIGARPNLTPDSDSPSFINGTRWIQGRARNMSGPFTFVFFVLVLSGSTNQSRLKFSGPSTFEKKCFLARPCMRRGLYLLHGSAENRRCSILRTSGVGATSNLNSSSDSPSLIYCKPVKKRFL